MILTTLPAQGRRHIGVEGIDIQRAYWQLLERGLPERFKRLPALSHRWILNLRYPNGLRVEFIGEAVVRAMGN